MKKNIFLLYPSKFLTGTPVTKDRFNRDFPGGSDGKASAYNVEDLGSIPGSGRSPGEGNGNLLEYSCRDREDWWAIVHGVTKSRKWLNN